MRDCIISTTFQPGDLQVSKTVLSARSFARVIGHKSIPRAKHANGDGATRSAANPQET
jgi:hypothetical protein